jgi:hypothetical protein
MNRLSLSTQTLYAQLLELLTALDVQRTIGQAEGTFTTKTVKGTEYYYYQYSIPGGGKKQVFVGRKDSSLDELVENFKNEKSLSKADIHQSEILSAQLRTGGAMATDAATGRVLKHLADTGLFRQNAALVGTHAFNVIGNLLGVQWSAGDITEDIDIATQVQIAVPELKTDIPETLEKLKMGFLPVPSLNPKHPATSFKVRGQNLKVDILTPAKKRGGTDPIYIKALNAAAQPLKYLDFLLEETRKAAVISGAGILVNVPDPTRFALHKLITANERDAIFHTKVEKDRQQACQVLSLLFEDRPGDIRLAIDAFRKRNWIQRLKKAAASLEKIDKNVYDTLKGLLS